MVGWTRYGTSWSQVSRFAFQAATYNICRKKIYGMIRDNLKKEIKKGERVAYSMGIDSAHWKKTKLAFLYGRLLREINLM
jgi:hypothetical protein